MKKMFSFKNLYSAIFHSTLIFIVLIFSQSCHQLKKTEVSVSGEKWLINNKLTNVGSPAEGLLLNVRMVNATFEDRGKAMPEEFYAFETNQNTQQFISKIPEYIASGVNAFTLCLQGGMPGYEGAVNTAFNPDGSLRTEYFKRVERVIKEVNKQKGVIILSCFYQRQHSHEFALTGKNEIKQAVKNTVLWVKEKGYKNIVLEISNEYNHRGFLNWNNGDWISSTEGQAELIQLAKSANPDLLVSTSGLGHGKMEDLICETADFILIHFNGTPAHEIPQRIQTLKKWGKPIVCNEDDKKGETAVKALELSIENDCSWGYMNNDQNQYMPFKFEGIADDTLVYQAFKKYSQL